MNADIREDDLFIDREKELHQLVRNLQRGKHTLIRGPKGIGKSRLMNEAVAVLRGERRRIELARSVESRVSGELFPHPDSGKVRFIFVSRTSPFGDCLKEIARQLLGMGALRLGPNGPVQGDWPTVKRQLTGLGTGRVQELICESLRATEIRYIVFIDSLDRISTTQAPFLEDLLQSAVVCAAAVQTKDVFQYKKIWSSFTRIDLEPFDDLTSGRLIDHLLEAYRIRVIDPELYRSEICKSANGNPFHIKNLIWQGSRDPRVSMDDIRKLRRTEEGELFNMGPIFIFLASILTLFKIFSIGMDNREFYIYFSALGFIVYITFRVFRTFFLFRPQRNK